MKLFPLYVTRYAIPLCVFLTTACRAQTPVETSTPAPLSNPQPRTRHETGGNISEKGRPIRFEPEPVTVPLKFSPQASDADFKITFKTETNQSTPVVIPVQIQPSVGTIAAIKIPVVLQIQSEQARVTEPSPTPHKDSEDHIGGISSGDLLTLIVALAAYVAAVRLFLKERLGNAKERLGDVERSESTTTQGNKLAERKQELEDAIAEIKDAIPRLALADFLFVAAALFLCWRLFIPLFTSTELKPSPWFIATVFGAAIIYLAYLHSREWVRHPRIKSFRDWLKKK
jgi:hypothetical protein